MWNIILDGVSIFSQYKVEIIIFFFCTFSLGFFAINQLANNQSDIKFILLASFSIGSIYLSIISYVLAVMTHFWAPMLRLGSLSLLLFVGLMMLKTLFSTPIKIGFNYPLIIAGAGLLLSVIVRLAYLKHLILPPYFDSPIHYQVALGLLNPDTNYNLKLSLDNIFVNYYHFGFHSLAAWLVSATQLDLLIAIPLLGQLFLFLAPMSVAAFTYIATNNLGGALFSGLLAATGWLMPAFSANWGKYPAITAITILPVAFSLPMLYKYNQDRKHVFLLYSLIAVIGIVLIHSRIIICLLLGITSYFLANKFKFQEDISFFQSIRFSILFTISLWPLSQLIMEFYREIPTWIILLTLMPFAFQYYPRITAGIFFYIFGLWLVALAPNLVNIHIQPLLDRPFLEIMLYIPFSIIGGIGFGGLAKKLGANNALKSTAFIILTGALILNLPQSNLFRPDPCCNYVTEDDQLALQWIQKNRSEHTLFIISTFTANNVVAGTDAGIWIYPLTKTTVNKLPFNTKWNSPKIFGEICSQDLNETYIYTSGRNFSFDRSQLEKETWAQAVFRAGKIVIYQIDECNK